MFGMNNLQKDKMSKMKIRLILIFFMFTSFLFSQNSEYENNIKKMLEYEGFEGKWNTLINQIISGQSGNISDIEFEKEIAKRSYPKLFEKVVMIYKKHLNENDVKSIVAFYETDAGRLLLAKNQIMMQEAIDETVLIGQEIANELGQEIENEKKTRYENNHSGCEKFKIGKFTYDPSDSSAAIIEREEKYQYEYRNGKKTTYSIKWLNECRCSLTLIHSEDQYTEDAVGNTHIINIFNTGLDYYEYIIKGNDDYMFESTLYKLE